MITSDIKNWTQKEHLQVIKTSPNRAYLASAIAYAKIPLWGTSDTLGTSGDILLGEFS